MSIGLTRAEYGRKLSEYEDRIAELIETLELTEDSSALVNRALYERRVQVESQSKRITLLEAVAEALVQQYYSNPYVTMHLAVYEALRAAGYLKEQEK